MSDQATTAKASPLDALRRHDWGHELLLTGLLLLIIVTMSLLSDRFFTVYNLFEMTRNYVEIGLLALPITFLILTGGIDLSVGSIVGVCAIVAGIVFESTGMMALAVICCIIVGSVCGLFNGFLIGKAGMAPMVATLATQYIYRGFALGVSEAKSYVGFPKWFQTLGLGSVGIFPIQLLIFVALCAVFAVLLNRVDLGRYVRAIGFNENAACYSNIDVKRIKYFLYFLSGLISSIVALIFISRITMSKANAGDGYELDAITVVVLGGTDIKGGRGTIAGTMLGVVIIGMLRNGLTLMRVPSETQNVIIGAILILSVLIKNLSNKTSKKQKTFIGGGDGKAA